MGKEVLLIKKYFHMFILLFVQIALFHTWLTISTCGKMSHVKNLQLRTWQLESDNTMMTDASGPVSEANKYHKLGSVCWGWSLLDIYRQGLFPPVHSFNKSDLSDLRKWFNDCFLSVFQHDVGGWSVYLRLGRDGTLMYSTVNGCTEQQTRESTGSAD